MHIKQFDDGGELKSMVGFRQFEEWQPHLMVVALSAMVW
jgi:hypothetical protein